MSYSIYIGEAYIADDDSRLSVKVERITREDAPSFPGDGMTGKSNGRHPSYSGWAEFVEEVGLQDLFFNEENGLMAEHPGCRTITESDLEEVRKALENRSLATPPGWCECPKCMRYFGPNLNPYQDHRDFDNRLARLQWLEFWMANAIVFCKRPAIYNS